MNLIFRILAAVVLIIPMLATAGDDERIVISDELELQKITGNCYIHTSYTDLPSYPHVPANGLVYVDEDKATNLTSCATSHLRPAFWISRGIDYCDALA